MAVNKQIKGLIQSKKRVVIAIDGPAGSGKSTLASSLANQFNTTIIPMDHFFLPKKKKTEERLAQAGGNIDRERFLSEVLFKLDNQTLTYQRFDCMKQRFITIHVTLAPVIIIEGVYALHEEFINYYDLKIFLDVDEYTQQKRILERSDIQMLDCYVKEWIPLENDYFARQKTKQKADIYGSIETLI